MKMQRLGFGAVLALGACFALAEEKPASKDDLKTLATNIVTTSAGIKEDDLVQINGSPDDVALMEELAVQCRKLGAHPLLSLGSDKLRLRTFTDVPAKRDTQKPVFNLKLAGLIDAALTVEYEEEGALAGVAADRMTAWQKAQEPVMALLIKRNVRQVFVGNSLYPSATRAKRFGMTRAELTRLFRAGLATQGKTLQASGEQVKKALASGKTLRLKAANGTDLTATIEKRPVLVSDGVLTPAKKKKGGAALMTWLPAGEVYVTPSTGDGKIVVDLAFWEGKEVKGLELTFKKGKLTKMSAKSGLERLEKVYKSHEAGKELLGVIDIGINPNIPQPKGNKALTWVASGMVTVMLGNNSWAGGDNNSPFGLTCHLPGCTLTVDGKTLVDKGKLKVGSKE